MWTGPLLFPLFGERGEQQRGERGKSTAPTLVSPSLIGGPIQEAGWLLDGFSGEEGPEDEMHVVSMRVKYVYL